MAEFRNTCVVSYAFAKGLGSKEIEEIQKWIDRHML